MARVAAFLGVSGMVTAAATRLLCLILLGGPIAAVEISWEPPVLVANWSDSPDSQLAGPSGVAPGTFYALSESVFVGNENNQNSLWSYSTDTGASWQHVAFPGGFSSGCCPIIGRGDAGPACATEPRLRRRFSRHGDRAPRHRHAIRDPPPPHALLHPAGGGRPARAGRLAQHHAGPRLPAAGREHLFQRHLAIGETVTVMLLSLSCLLSRYCHATVIYCHLLPLLLLW